jgi:hypothetical protein
MGSADMTRDERIQSRVEELTQEAEVTLAAIRNLSVGWAGDPLTDPATLTQAVQTGILDAPHLKNNPYGCGKINSLIDHRGACVAINPLSGNPINEDDRIASLLHPSSASPVRKED